MRLAGHSRRHQSPPHFRDVGIPGLEPINQYLCRCSGLERLAASEDIRCRVAIFRPGMDGNVGLSYREDPGDPLGAESVKGLTDDLGTDFVGCQEH